MKATLPFAGKPSANEALTLSKVEIWPKQLGPNKFMPLSRHFLAISNSNSLFPTSPKPAVIILIFLD